MPAYLVGGAAFGGAGCLAVDLVMGHEVQNAFCAVRPPGTMPSVRTQWDSASSTTSRSLPRMRWPSMASSGSPSSTSTHHGNGTEDIFKGNDKVLMCSIFQHPFYPYSGADNPAPNMCGTCPPSRFGRWEFRDAVTGAWLPRLEEFKPQMIFISAGFDAHYEDDMGSPEAVREGLCVGDRAVESGGGQARREAHRLHARGRLCPVGPGAQCGGPSPVPGRSRTINLQRPSALILIPINPAFG